MTQDEERKVGIIRVNLADFTPENLPWLMKPQIDTLVGLLREDGTIAEVSHLHNVASTSRSYEILRILPQVPLSESAEEEVHILIRNLIADMFAAEDISR